MSEAIDCDGGSSEGSADKCGGKGPLIGGIDGRDVSFHHNLMSANKGRNPMIKNKGGVVDVVNNVIFPSTDISLIADSQYATQSINFVGNRILGVPGVNNNLLGARLAPPYNGGRLGCYKLYVEGNIGALRQSVSDPENWIVNPTSPGDPNFNARTYVCPGEGPIMQANRIPAPLVQASSAAQAYSNVLAEVGASRKLDNQGNLILHRDSTDTRIINDVASGISETIATEPWPGIWPVLQAGTAYTDSDSDGMADAWEMAHFGSLARGDALNSSADLDGDGYTDLEEFLNGTDPNEGAQPNASLSAPFNVSITP